MWGQDVEQALIRSGLGIIPTRVGTSTKVYHDIMCEGDHPHACGDKTTKFIF